MSELNLTELAAQLHRLQHTSKGMLPNKRHAERFLNETLEIIFPNIVGDAPPCTADDIRCKIESAEVEIELALRPIKKWQSHANGHSAQNGHEKNSKAHRADVIHHFFHHRLSPLIEMLWLDAQAMYEGDPAAQSVDEVIGTYPGLLAVSIHRIAHEFYQLGLPIFPRMLSEIGHARTGIDIHPGATIGKSFCIDHGTGIVIGETATLGDHVKLYQGVSLGALSVDKSLASSKRHPTIEDHVVIYANATILGGETVIGHHSVIGGNVFITKSVAPHSVVYHKAQVSLRNKLDPQDPVNVDQQEPVLDFVI
jgi:serine O-acetyltransferase